MDGITIHPTPSGFELRGNDGTFVQGFGTLAEVERFLDWVEIQQQGVGSEQTHQLRRGHSQSR